MKDQRSDKINKPLLIFLFLYFLVHVVIMHVNQGQISKFKIKGKKEYAVMTFIIVYFPYLFLLPSIFLSYKNRFHVIQIMLLIATVLYFVYIGHSVIFLEKYLKAGVSKEQDKQRKLCHVNVFLTLFGYLFFAGIAMFKLEDLEKEMKIDIEMKRLNFVNRKTRQEDIDRHQFEQYQKDVKNWYTKLQDKNSDFDTSDNFFYIFDNYAYPGSYDSEEKAKLQQRFFEEDFTQDKLLKAKTQLETSCGNHENCKERIAILEQIMKQVQNLEAKVKEVNKKSSTKKELTIDLTN